MRVHGADVDDGATVHVRERVVAIKENRPEIDCLHTIPLFHTEVDDILKGHHRCAVDDNVQAAPFIERGLNG